MKKLPDLKKQVEALKRELKIEASLERVRTVAMAMKKADDMLHICKIIAQQLQKLGIKEIRNVQTAIIFKQSGIYRNYEFYAKHNKLFTTDVVYTNHPMSRAFIKKMLEGPNEFFKRSLSAKKTKEWYAFQKTTNQFADKFLLKASSLNYYWYSLGPVALGISTYEPLSKEEQDLFVRFRNVFELSYRRYLDIEKAEAQAKEAQIEAALEKVRAAAMSMHKPDDLLNICQVLFKELSALGFDSLRNAMINIHNDEKKSLINYDYSDETGRNTTNHAYDIHPLVEKQIKTIRSANDAFSETYFTGRDLTIWKNFRKRIGEKEDPGLNKNRGLYYYFYSIGIGSIGISTFGAINEEMKALLKRFRNVFALSYQRYIDISKAEAQARENKIQLALERMRARTMAMQHSNELPETSHILFQQMKELGEPVEQLTIGVVNEENNVVEISATLHGDTLKKIYNHSIDEPYMIAKVYKAWKKQQKTLVVELRGDELNAYNQYRNELTNSKMFPTNLGKEHRRIVYAAFFSKGMLALGSNETRPPESLQLLEKFASVFDLTYTRFLDLQKAEAQTREAQIEAALERVRSRTMAMHKSDELSEAVFILFNQFKELGEKPDQATIGIINEKEWEIEFWVTMYGNQMDKVFKFSIDEPHVTNRIYKAWKEEKKSLVINLSGNELNEFTHYREKMGGAKHNPDEKNRVFNVAFFSKGLLIVQSNEAHSEESIHLLERFAAVFEQTYTRFLDLQKAEAQAREAQIEAALERVRSKAMAMHNSNDLPSTAIIAFTELKKLGFNLIRGGVGLLTKENRKVILYSATSSGEDDNLSLVGWAMLQNHPVLAEIYNSWLRGKDYFPVLKGELLKTYYAEILSSFAVPASNYEQSLPGNSINNTPDDYVQYGSFIAFSSGFFYLWTANPANETEINILKRFASVVDLTFKRYFDLQKAEELAVEAVKRSSVDRVRAEIASMRTPADLEKITPLIWKELTVLNIPFVRCGVFIMDEAAQLIHTFLSTPDGNAIAAFRLPFASTPLTDSVEYWRAKKIYHVHWGLDTYAGFADSIAAQGIAVNKELYLSTVPQEGIHLHLLPFLQGMLYVGNTTQLSDEQLHLLQSVADAFSTAYARYEDFIKLEEAKQQTENALTNLQAAQKQLIQSEKMASLGELTAGIAHEIQNPLNFVNNFSEVSSELISEMVEEVGKGNYDEVKAIADDVKQNLEKINHHGKRAGDIVKGMLQHSRSSSGLKEPTNINALADEYLRLAYHGLRAKDKTFNATMKTDFDEGIGNINIIPQDIGRVILNLITNAFYVVNEKSKSPQPLKGGEEYEPTVTISTSSIQPSSGGRSVQIKVSDNGGGIPQNIIDKIFQPFFTTKPTGQGTGLGLSLSYDIVKAHGGELKVETKEGEGSAFVIQLPIN